MFLEGQSVLLQCITSKSMVVNIMDFYNGSQENLDQWLGYFVH